MSKKTKKVAVKAKRKPTKAKVGSKASAKVKKGVSASKMSKTKTKTKTKAKTKGTAKVSSKLAQQTKSKSKSRTKAKSKAKISFIPKGYSNVTPYLIISNAAKAIQFYKDIFGAKEIMRMDGQQGKIMHAEMHIGDSKIMLSDEMPEMNAKGPDAFGGCAIGIHLYLKDVDTTIEKAMDAGARLERPATDMFYGDRVGTIIDPFGHKWSIATHIEDVTPKEMKKRMATFSQSTETPESKPQSQPFQPPHEQNERDFYQQL